MGTRGYLIFKYKGLYYVFYNNNDSYISCMGMSLAKDIKNLCKRFHGNIYLALEHLRGLVDLVTIISEKEVEVEGEVPDTFEGKTMIFKSTSRGFL